MRRFLCLVLLCLLAACAKEKPPPGGYWNPFAANQPPRDENYHGGPAAILQRYDANKDGTLTRDELIAGLKAEFATHHPDAKGCLPDDEVAAINQQRIDQDQTTATPLVDWNRDNCLDYGEFSAFAYSLFDQIDRNRDGKITPQEFHPGARPPARGQLPGEQAPGSPPRGGPGQGGGPPGGGGGGPPPRESAPPAETQPAVPSN